VLLCKSVTSKSCLRIPAGEGSRVGEGRRILFTVSGVGAFVLSSFFGSISLAQLPDAEPPERMQSLSGNFTGQTDRPLRYFPDGRDFVITNGAEYFNRPLYGGNVAFRVDGGDRPEFSFYLPGRGGNLRFGLRSQSETRWLDQRAHVVSRYKPGGLDYEISGDAQNAGVVRLSLRMLRDRRALIGRIEMGSAASGDLEIVLAFGGVDGMRGRRGGDIGCESEPVSRFFQLRPEQCRNNLITTTGSSFIVRGPRATMAGIFPGARGGVADGKQWREFSALLADLTQAGSSVRNDTPVVVMRRQIAANQPLHFVIVQTETNATAEVLARGLDEAKLGELFRNAELQRQATADRVVVDTPDPFINSAATALNVAADAVWDEPQRSFMHGAVAWRSRLLGWRGVYSGDALGWHERTRQHLEGFFRQQNTNPVPDKLATPEESANLSRNENALHSNGNLTKNHYDMNLVAVDAFFRYLLWTGDLEFARQQWPVIERHLAWERRLFRREFGPDKLPLYEGYANFWASDDVAYNGGGAAQASAYNYYHNKMAARVAKLLGKDATSYEREAELIAKAMRRELWLPDRGWFAEYKDWLGLQLVHPNAAAWTFYHAVDSGLPSPQEAWQISRFVDTQIARIPVRGPRALLGGFTLPTTSWMPYAWSVNNVVMAEVAHTSLAYWQANRVEEAFGFFKGCLLDSMFLGLCPGNVGMCTEFDAYRHESQRDFADGVGATSRALIEGLFGVRPDALAGELQLYPGFPVSWEHATLNHPDVTFAYHRDGMREIYEVEQKFSRPLALTLRAHALRDGINAVFVNGTATTWKALEESVGVPRVEIRTPPTGRQVVEIHWSGEQPKLLRVAYNVGRQKELRINCSAEITDLADPQIALAGARFQGASLRGLAAGTAGHRTVFAKVQQGALSWWQTITFQIHDESKPPVPLDWKHSMNVPLESVNLVGVFNDKVTQIFRNEYLSPRSPFCSLALPKQGIGSWCLPKTTFDVDDSGLRELARKSGGQFRLPNGVTFATPGETDAKNIAFVSQWDNHPREIAVPLNGKSSRAFLLMAGSTNPMQTGIDNGEVIVSYADGSTARLPLRNPTTWWPIEQDYFIDDYAFRYDGALPPRVDLKTGKIRVLEVNSFKGRGGKVPGGAATVLDLPLDPKKDLQSLTVRALANEVVIGLMSVTLAR